MTPILENRGEKSAEPSLLSLTDVKGDTTTENDIGENIDNDYYDCLNKGKTLNFNRAGNGKKY